MKLVLDTKTGELKYGQKTFSQLDGAKKTEAENAVRKFIIENTKIDDYELDSIWMSYRYCVGRHTIASHYRAGDIWRHSKGRMSKERAAFNAYDINREIEHNLSFQHPNFRFPVTSYNELVKGRTAIDVFCEFMEDYDIKSVDDLLKYESVEVILTDNERGYKLEPMTWEEYLRPKVLDAVREFYQDNTITEDDAWKTFTEWKGGIGFPDGLKKKFEELTRYMPKKEYYFMGDIEDLFVWSELAHLFDEQSHHKSILVDGTEAEWFWGWTNNTEKHDDGYYYRSFGYHKIRIPVDKWGGVSTYSIPDESIKKDLY